MRQAEVLYPGQPFRILSDLGEVVILPPELGDEIRNESKLSFAAAVAIVCSSYNVPHHPSHADIVVIGLPHEYPSLWSDDAGHHSRPNFAERCSKAIN